MPIADLILRWVHIMGAIMLVGGTVFMRTVYIPAREMVDDKPGEEFAEKLRKLFARLIMIASAWLLISGLINIAMLLQRYDVPKLYHMVFGIKFLLALIIFFLTAAVSGRSSLAKKMQQREKTWWTVNLVLTGLVIFLAAILHSTERTEKPASSAPRQQLNRAIAVAAAVVPQSDRIC